MNSGLDDTLDDYDDKATQHVSLPTQDLGLLAWLEAGMVAVAMIAAALGALQVVVTSRISQPSLTSS